MELLHFSHSHPLLLKNNTEEERESLDCYACMLPIGEGSEYYGCEYDKCEFNIHSSCAKLPQKIEHHPFHPQHTLLQLGLIDSLLTDVCNICGFATSGFTFHCSECKFDMDLRCAVMMPMTIDCKRTQQILKNSRHPHPLLICVNNNIGYSPVCHCCWLPIITEAPVLVCLECPALMHESCAEFPQEVQQHIFHPQHPLNLTIIKDFRRVACDACGTYFCGASYRCKQCNFDLEVSCASLTPTTNEKDDDDNDDDDAHPHPLIECYKKTKSLRHLACSGCMGLFKEKESIYVCLRCPKLLHKSCARSPRQIDHPFHPSHPLTLYDETHNGQTQLCRACMKRSFEENSHFYRCYECRFYLHSKCALPVAPFLNSQAVLHRHPLAFLDIKEALPCNACKLLRHYPFFRCAECDFNLHVHCLSMLPPTIKHKCHLHPLTLTHSPVKDHEDEDDDAEFYCDACEKYRLLNEPTYYCVECHYVAHVHCVISEIFPCLEREFASLGEKLEKMKLEKALDVVEDIAVPELQRDAQKEKLEVLEGAFIGVGIEDDLVTTRADDSSAEAVKELVDTAGEALHAELDAEIMEQSIKLDQLKKRRAQYLSSLQK